MSQRPALARGLVVGLLISLAALAFWPGSRSGLWPVHAVTADGRPLKDLFDGLRASDPGIKMRDRNRANARLAKHQSRPPWLNGFLDIFDDNVVYADSCTGNEATTPTSLTFCTTCGGNFYNSTCLGGGAWCDQCCTFAYTRCGTNCSTQYAQTSTATPPSPSTCCNSNSDCTGGGCNMTCSGGISGGTCQNNCLTDGTACNSSGCSSTNCCGGHCYSAGAGGNANKCFTGAGLGLGVTCGAPGDCASGYCSTTCCLTTDMACTSSSQCCGNLVCKADHYCGSNDGGCGGGGGGCGGCEGCGGGCEGCGGGDCCDSDCEDGQCGGYTDPIIIDTTGNGYQMTSAKDGVLFTVRSTSKPVQLSWTAAGSGDAWLALDLNHNGRIDDMTEMFSNYTRIPGGSQRAANGFDALAAYDLPQNGGNGDGVISAKDAVYNRLLLWIDKNHNGISEPDELFTMSQLGVASISLNYSSAKYTDQYGNVFRYRSAMARAPGAHIGQLAYDVVLQPVRGGNKGGAARRALPDGQKVQPPKPVAVAPGRLVAGNPPSRGRGNAPVTLAVFSDFQCPFCAKAAKTIAGIENTYGDDVRVVYRYYPLPFHAWALPAAKAAACVHAQSRTRNDEAFWKLHDYYFQHQAALTSANVAEESFDFVKTIPGLNVATYQRCIEAPATAAAVKKDIQLGDSVLVHGTPTFFVNGQPVSGAEDGVAQAIAQAKAGDSRSGKGARAPSADKPAPTGAVRTTGRSEQ